MKNSYQKSALSIFVATSSAVILSCGTPKLALKGTDWEHGNEMHAVTGRQGILINQRLSFGQYATQKVNRSWTKESSWSIGVGKHTLEVPTATNVIAFDHITRKQTLRFAAESLSGEYADVYAASHVKARELRIGEENAPGGFVIDLTRLFSKSSNNLYYVQIYLNGNMQPWQLILDNEVSQWQPGKYVGYLYGPNNRYYELKPVRHLENKNGEAKQIAMGHIGFEVLDEGGTGLAAVSIMDKGQVYFSNAVSPKERFLLENLCAAILLQEQI